MFRRTLASATFVLMTILIMSACANAQTESKVSSPTPTPKPQNQSIINTTKSNTKDYRVAANPETGGTKGWEGKVQDKVLVTAVMVNFDNPADHDNFAVGKLRLNLILKNTASGQTIRLDSRQLIEGFRPGPDKSKLTINVIVDNMSAPLSEAACGVITPAADNSGDDVNITLSYAGCASAPAQRPGGPIPGVIVKKNEGTRMSAGNPIHGIIVKGGKNPGGNLNIVVGDSRVTTREAATEMSRLVGATAGVSSKGAGSPKVAGF